MWAVLYAKQAFYAFGSVVVCSFLSEFHDCEMGLNFWKGQAHVNRS
jgi:hypothetical protein